MELNEITVMLAQVHKRKGEEMLACSTVLKTAVGYVQGTC
jgi:hypothetical protein